MIPENKLGLTTNIRIRTCVGGYPQGLDCATIPIWSPGPCLTFALARDLSGVRQLARMSIGLNEASANCNRRQTASRAGQANAARTPRSRRSSTLPDLPIPHPSQASRPKVDRLPSEHMREISAPSLAAKGSQLRVLGSNKACLTRLQFVKFVK